MTVPAHYVRVFAATNINSAVANGGLLHFDTIYYDSNGFAPTGAPFSTIAVPAGLGGVYLINGWSSTTANQSTTMGLGILINGAASFLEANQSISGPASVSYTLDLGAVSVLLLNPGDTVALINNSVSPGPNVFRNVTLSLTWFGQPDTSLRTITQVASGRGTDTLPDVLFALANDGTVWRLSVKLNETIWYLIPPLPAPRTVTQIVTGRGTSTLPDVLFALADDGTVWRLSLKLHQGGWSLIPPLPTGALPLPLPI